MAEAAEDWEENWDDAQAAYFYYNLKSGETTWERPAVLGPEPEDQVYEEEEGKAALPRATGEQTAAAVSTPAEVEAAPPRPRTPDPPPAGASDLWVAASEGDWERLQDLVDAGASPQDTAADGTSALYVAAARGHEFAVGELLHGHADPRWANPDPEGDPGAAAPAVGGGADPNRARPNGATPLIAGT